MNKQSPDWGQVGVTLIICTALVCYTLVRLFG